MVDFFTSISLSKDFIERSLPSLLNHHIFKDSEGLLGTIVLDLGKAETYAIKKARNQAGKTF